MGPVTLGDEDVEITVDGVEYWGDVANVGNPHLVCFVIDPARGPGRHCTARASSSTPASRSAPTSSSSACTRPTVIDMRVWERGVGETLSCGTGACAAAAVAHNRGVVDDRVRVRVPGGELDVALGDDGPARWSGRARVRRRHRPRRSNRPVKQTS